MTTYSAAGDMLLGSITVTDSTTQTPFIQDASDRIDAVLGNRYLTPIVIDESVPANRSSFLLLKMIANYLASGMFIVAQAAPSEDNALNAYGAKLIATAEQNLSQLAMGDVTLTGATYLNEGDVGQSGPIINNADPTSLVDNFYAYTSAHYTSGFGHFGNPLFSPNRG